MLSFVLLVPLARAASPSELGDLTVTEFQADTSKVPQYYGEWFEIYNNSGANLDLQGLEITHSADSNVITVDSSVVLAAGDYLVFGVSTDTSLNGNVTVDIEYDSSFNLDGPADSLTLTVDGTLIDEVVWDSSWGVTKDYAHSAAKNAFDNEWANDLSVNWCPSQVFISGSGMYGSPGAANEYCGDEAGVDNDGDGYTEADGDCNDADFDVNPGEIDGSEEPYGEANDDADCDGVRDDGDVDDDGDGYTEVDGDCDDDDINTYPGAIETDDGEDDNCNDCVDDLDSDRDGYGYSADGGPSGGECGDDCDDSKASINPAATEVAYDGVDQNCDGEDECDLDGDNYEATSDYGPSCNGYDCDDGNPDIHPGAIEQPANGADDDCDGDIDIPDRDEDGFTEQDGDCMDVGEGQGASAAAIAISPTVNPQAPEICGDLVDNDCDGFIDNLPDCVNPASFGRARGGGLCGTASPAGAGLLLAVAGLAALRRRGEGR